MVRSGRLSRSVSVILAGAVAGATLLCAASSVRAADEVDFNKDIKPIFKQSCIRCHQVTEQHKKASAGFRLDNRADAMKGGENGHEKDIIPGKGSDSYLYKLLLGPVNIDGEDVDAMPKPKKGQEFKKLPEAQIELIKKWIDQGAKWSG